MSRSKADRRGKNRSRFERWETRRFAGMAKARVRKDMRLGKHDELPGPVQKRFVYQDGWP